MTNRKVYIQATDPDEASELVASHFRAGSTVIRPHTSTFAFDVAARVWPEFSLTLVSWAGQATVTGAAVGCFTVTEVLDGRCRFQRDRLDLPLQPGDVTLSPGQRPTSGTHADLTARVLTIDKAAVGRVAAQAGAPPNVRFTGWTPVSAAAGRDYRLALNLASEWVRQVTLFDTDLAARMVADLVAHAALHTFPNTALAAEPEPTERYEQSAVARAVSYVHEHFQHSIGVPEIARAARVSDRTVNAIFRARFGEPPMQYVRGLRLEAARRQLRMTDPATKGAVRLVAAQWGFVSPQHFAAAYRKRFGETPTDTLNGGGRR